MASRRNGSAGRKKEIAEHQKERRRALQARHRATLAGLFDNLRKVVCPLEKTPAKWKILHHAKDFFQEQEAYLEKLLSLKAHPETALRALSGSRVRGVPARVQRAARAAAVRRTRRRTWACPSPPPPPSPTSWSLRGTCSSTGGRWRGCWGAGCCCRTRRACPWCPRPFRPCGRAFPWSGGPPTRTAARSRAPSPGEAPLRSPLSPTPPAAPPRTARAHLDPPAPPLKRTCSRMPTTWFRRTCLQVTAQSWTCRSRRSCTTTSSAS
ncbi:uncharacterized protein LOC135245848 isoform X3 [Anguilla rostrata]|uniref:uncharacterized protein LOC135245848 isoform X3 n=1 Tax=Anguilla rostrata TaxID=7938 RepID=UPI0030D37AC8